VTLDHKTSHKGNSFEIQKKLSIDVWFVCIGTYLAEIQQFKNLENCPFIFAIMLHSLTKTNVLYICGTKYLHGT